MSDLIRHESGPQYRRVGKALVTPGGFVLYRPRVLPRDRWLVSDSEDGIHYRVYRRNGRLRRLFTGKRWRCVSGLAEFGRAYDAWNWVEAHCVNRLGPNDWHGVGYARWMKAQHLPDLPKSHPLHFDPWLCNFTLEPSWVYQFYHAGPPNWDMPEDMPEDV